MDTSITRQTIRQALEGDGPISPFLLHITGRFEECFVQAEGVLREIISTGTADLKSSAAEELMELIALSERTRDILIRYRIVRGYQAWVLQTLNAISPPLALRVLISLNIWERGQLNKLCDAGD